MSKDDAFSTKSNHQINGAILTATHHPVSIQVANNAIQNKYAYEKSRYTKAEKENQELENKRSELFKTCIKYERTITASSNVAITI